MVVSSRRLVAAVLALVSAAVPVVLVAPPALADGPTVTGAGSTWSQIAVDQWRADVASAQALNVNYSGVGSSAGRQFFVINQVDFAVSEIPFLPDEVGQLKGRGRTWAYLPIVAGGTSFMYNLTDPAGRAVRDLRLSPDTVGKIFTGQITDWSDPVITADYGKALPKRPITPVIRSDGSGTSAQFSAYLARQTSGIWGKFAREQGIPAESTSNWPAFSNSVAQKGSDGVANFVANPGTGVGSIGYVETGYAVQRRFPVAALKNRSGRYVLPTSRNVATALTLARLNSDQTQNLDAVYVNPDPNVYPMSSYSYMIVPTTGLDPAKGDVISKFMAYFACAGQQKATILGYSPLPANLVKVVFDAIGQVPGHANFPAPTAANCANPALTGSLGQGATDILPGSAAWTPGAGAVPGSGTFDGGSAPAAGGAGGPTGGGPTGGGSTGGGTPAGSGSTAGGSTGALPGAGTVAPGGGTVAGPGTARGTVTGRSGTVAAVGGVGAAPVGGGAAGAGAAAGGGVDAGVYAALQPTVLQLDSGSGGGAAAAAVILVAVLATLAVAALLGGRGWGRLSSRRLTSVRRRLHVPHSG